MSQIIEVLRLGAWRWTLIATTAGLAAALIGEWSAAVVMLVVVAAALSVATRRLDES